MVQAINGTTLYNAVAVKRRIAPLSGDSVCAGESSTVLTGFIVRTGAGAHGSQEMGRADSP